MTTEFKYDASDVFNKAVSLYRKHCEKEGLVPVEPATAATEFSYTPDGEGVRVVLNTVRGRLYQADVYSRAQLFPFLKEQIPSTVH